MTAAPKDTLIMLIPMLTVLVLVIVWPAVVLLMPSFAAPEFMRYGRRPYLRTSGKMWISP